MRNITFTPQALEDVVWWLEHDRRVLSRVLRLLGEAARDPSGGTGKPERLKGDKSGWWSRRITSEHRLIYQVSEAYITILSCRGHYT